MYANGLLVGLACVPIVVFFLAVTRETWVGLPAAGFVRWPAGRAVARPAHGHGVTLRASGIEAAKAAGTLVIPWDALAAQPPGRDKWWEIKLAYARPDLIAVTGWVHERAVVVFEGADPDLLPRRSPCTPLNPAGGTHAELESLQAGMSGALRRIREVVEPASTRTSLRRLMVGLVLFLGATAVAGMSGWWQWLAIPFAWTGLRQLFLAVAGWRAARRAHQAPAVAEASTPVRSR